MAAIDNMQSKLFAFLTAEVLKMEMEQNIC